MNIGEAIKALRIERGLTQEALALDADVATSHLSRIEQGKRKPSEDALARLAVALGTSLTALYSCVEKPSAGANISELNDVEALDYSHGGVSIRRLFRELTPENQRLAVDLIRALRRHQAENC